MRKKLLPLSKFSNFTALALFYPLNVRSTALALFFFSEGRIKIRKGFFPAFFSIRKFSDKNSWAESKKQIYIKMTHSITSR